MMPQYYLLISNEIGDKELSELRTRGSGMQKFLLTMKFSLFVRDSVWRCKEVEVD